MSDLRIGGTPLAKLKVAELKTELETRGLEKTGRKDELVARLASYMEVNEGEGDSEASSEANSRAQTPNAEAEAEAKVAEEKAAAEKVAEEENVKKEEEKAEKQKVADEKKREKEEKEKKAAKEEAEKKIQASAEKAKKEEEAERKKQDDAEKAKKEKAEKKRIAEETEEAERKKKDEKVKEEERAKKEEQKKAEKAKEKEKRAKEDEKSQKDELRKKEEAKAKEDKKKKDIEKQKEEQRQKDEQKQKDRQRRFDDEKKDEAEKARALAEKKSKEESSTNGSKAAVNGNSKVEDSKKAETEEEALDFEPEVAADDTLVMEVDQHDLVEEDQSPAPKAAQPGEVTSLRKLGGNRVPTAGGERKRGWGAGGGRLGSGDTVAISSNTLKDLVPDLKPLLAGDTSVGSPADLDDDVSGPKAPKAANEPPKKRKKIPEVDLNETEVVMVTNLTRPFTVNQLKEMLKRTGTIVDFWIDRIKSKCCVEFSSSDQASETRMALDGVTWPQGNPKTLKVTFSSKEDMKRMQEGGEEGVMGRLGAEQEARGGVRDWDRNKVDQEQEREKERERRRGDREVREREAKSEERAPAVVTKSLEDLFKKTTAGPAIYWRPLSEEEIEEKIKQRSDKMQEVKSEKELLDSKEVVEKNNRMGEALGVPTRRRSKSHSNSPR